MYTPVPFNTFERTYLTNLDYQRPHYVVYALYDGGVQTNVPFIFGSYNNPQLASQACYRAVSRQKYDPRIAWITDSNVFWYDTDGRQWNTKKIPVR